jgi:hypothetical protein
VRTSGAFCSTHLQKVKSDETVPNVLRKLSPGQHRTEVQEQVHRNVEFPAGVRMIPSLGVVNAAETKRLQAGVIDIPPHTEHADESEDPKGADHRDKQGQRNDGKADRVRPEDAGIRVAPEKDQHEVGHDERNQERLPQIDRLAQNGSLADRLRQHEERQRNQQRQERGADDEHRVGNRPDNEAGFWLGASIGFGRCAFQHRGLSRDLRRANGARHAYRPRPFSFRANPSYHPFPVRTTEFVLRDSARQAIGRSAPYSLHHHWTARARHSPNRSPGRKGTGPPSLPGRLKTGKCDSFEISVKCAHCVGLFSPYQ